MKKTTRRTLCKTLAVAPLVGFAAPNSITRAEDDAELIRGQCQVLLEAWNRHDAKRAATPFADDGDWIDPSGRVARGRAEVERALTDLHGAKSPMRTSKMENQAGPPRFPTADVALTDAEITLSSVQGRTAPVVFHLTSVWKKTQGKWRIYACRAYAKTTEAEAGLPPR